MSPPAKKGFCQPYVSVSQSTLDFGFRVLGPKPCNVSFPEGADIDSIQGLGLGLIEFRVFGLGFSV